MTTVDPIAPATRVAGRLPERPGDAGVTMIEVVTTMTLMSVLMVIFTAAILQVYHFTNRGEAVADTRAQVHTVFLRLDRELRYASGISEPGAAGADHYVEYLIARTDDKTGFEVETCVGLHLLGVDRQLRVAEWPKDGSRPSESDAAWVALASGVTSSQPFTLLADTTTMYQRLTLDLTADSGAGRTASSAQLKATFTALNALIDTANASICAEGRPTAP